MLPITDAAVALGRMLTELTRSGKKVLVALDGVYPTRHVRIFAQQLQMFMRRQYSVFALMAGSYEDISDLQNEKSLTSLYRAIKFAMGPLDLAVVAQR